MSDYTTESNVFFLNMNLAASDKFDFFLEGVYSTSTGSFDPFDLPLPEGSELQDEADTLICNVTVIAEEAEEAPAEEVEEAEPEIIGEKKEEEETEDQAPGASS